MEKERVDLLVVQQGLTDSREKAKRLVMAGQVVDAKTHVRYDKPGEKLPITTELLIKGETLRYVSRGGLKLEKALQEFDVSVQNKILLDIGSSTGGFTDAALQHGAKLCYALDVGYNQLDYKLRQDERVVVMERVNFRYSQADDFDRGLPTIASIDVSFISLRLILPVLATILVPQGDVLMLIKPQFEAGKDRVGKKGIVRDLRVHQEVLEEVLQFAQGLGYVVRGLTYSPITGGSGNIEFLAHVTFTQEMGTWTSELQQQIIEVVQQAHETLKK